MNSILCYFFFLFSFKFVLTFIHMFSSNVFCILPLTEYLQSILNLLSCRVRNMDLISLFCLLVSLFPEPFIKRLWLFSPFYISHYLSSSSSFEKFLFSYIVWFYIRLLVSLFFSYFLSFNILHSNLLLVVQLAKPLWELALQETTQYFTLKFWSSQGSFVKCWSYFLCH